MATWVFSFSIKRWRETEEVLPKQKKAFTPHLPAVFHMETNLLLLSLCLSPLAGLPLKPEHIEGPQLCVSASYS